MSIPPRYACLRVPGLPWVAELRAHPELAGRPLAIASGPGPRAEIVAVSPEAARAGVRPCASALHARSVCAELAVRIASPALERAAREALLDVAFSVSPRAALLPRGSGVYASEAAVLLDASGLAALFPSEAGLATALGVRARSVGLPGRVAVASSGAVAHLATRCAEDPETASCILPPGAEAAFLAPLPIDLLDPGPELAARLTRFGVNRIGALLRLPARALATRLGPEVLRLVALARGQAETPPLPGPRDARFEEAVDLECSVDRLEPLGFVLRGLLSRLTERLALRGLACGDLALQLGLEGGGREALRVGVAAPTLDPRGLLRLVLLALESHPPAAAVTTVSLTAEGSALRPDQLDLFRPAGPSPAVLSRTLAELEALCGPDRVGRPAVKDDHRPEAFAMQPFGSCDPHARAPDRGDVPPGLALRSLRPPVPADVRAPGGRPVWIRSAAANGRIEALAGPWRTSGAWWSGEERFAYDHFDVRTSDGVLSRLRFDALHRTWHVDAIYD